MAMSSTTPYFAVGAPLDEERERLLERVRRLGEERIGPRAARYDREACHPTESWRDLWEHGLLGLKVPRRYGGIEADGLTYVLVIEMLARYCAATAMTLNMHSTVMSFIDALGTEAQKARLYPLVVEEGHVFGSWASEPNTSVNRAYVRELSVRPYNGGYLLNGVKHFCTMAGAAIQAIVWGTMEGAPNYLDGAILVLVHRDNPGYRIVGGWDPLGMRATVSPSTVFENCYVEADALLGQPGQLIHIGVREQFALGYAAVYLGIATGALGFTLEYCRTRTFAPSPTPIAHDVTIQHHIGRVAALLDGARLALLDAGRRWDAAGAAERGLVAARAKYLCMQAGLATTETCMQVIGGRSALKELPVERAYRDLRTCTLMPPSHDAMLELLGRHELRLPATLFRT